MTSQDLVFLLLGVGMGASQVLLHYPRVHIHVTAETVLVGRLLLVQFFSAGRHRQARKAHTEHDSDENGAK
jgi:hypothetical protein